MIDKTDQSPTVPFCKKNRQWTFYVFPDGVQTEAGEYPDEEAARTASWKSYRQLASQRLQILTCRFDRSFKLRPSLLFKFRHHNCGREMRAVSQSL